MEVALTFGSLGDIIQLCQLAIQLGRAVGVGCGAVGESAREYQDLRDDLDTFVHVVATYQQHELSPYLQGLDNVSKSVVNQCAALIQDTLDHIQSRYGKSLGIEGSGKKIKDIYKRIEWSVREKERLQNLRDKLQEGVQRLSLLTSLAAEKSARVDNATVLARIDQVQNLVSEARVGQEDLLKCLQEHQAASEKQAETQLQKLDEVNKQLVTQGKGTWSILASAKDALSGIIEVKNLLIQVSQNVIDLQVTASHSMSLRPLDPTKGIPVILEDALGRPLEIPAQWVDTIEWEVLNGLLKGYFKGHKGHDMVLREEYALEESASGRDLNTELPLHRSLRRGMKINMSMIFQSTEIIVGVCPRCHTETDAPEDVNVKCSVTDCGMWFRMQKQVVDASDLLSSGSDDDESSDETLVGKEATVVTSIPVEPGDFQRVRLLRPYEAFSQSDASDTDIEPHTTILSDKKLLSNPALNAGEAELPRHLDGDGDNSESPASTDPTIRDQFQAETDASSGNSNALPTKASNIEGGNDAPSRKEHPNFDTVDFVTKRPTPPPRPPAPGPFSEPRSEPVSGYTTQHRPDQYPGYVMQHRPDQYPKYPSSAPLTGSVHTADYDADVSDMGRHNRHRRNPRESVIYINGEPISRRRERKSKANDRIIIVDSRPEGLDSRRRRLDAISESQFSGQIESEARVRYSSTRRAAELTTQERIEAQNRIIAEREVVVDRTMYSRDRRKRIEDEREEEQRQRLRERMQPRRRDPAAQRRRVLYDDSLYR